MLAKISVERSGLEGQGVGFDESRNIYFVVGGIPGDRLLVEFDTDKRRYRDARLVEILEPSGDRIDPNCKHFGICGGCDWLNFKYEAQLEAKAATLKHVLDRAELKPKHTHAVVPSPQVYNYRNRIQVKQVKGKVGFHKRQSEEIVAIEECRLADPKLNEELGRLREEADATTSRKVEIWVTEKGEVKRIFDQPHGAAGFTQVNGPQNERLKVAVREALVSSESKRVLELYCGDGNLTEAYANSVDEVVGVDINDAAIAKASARGIKASFLRGEIGGATLKKLSPGFRDRYDTLVLDPPRSGIGAGLARFLHSNLKTIVYVSCSPLTFSQDVKGMEHEGWTFESVLPIDMFPHTRHLEIVGLFRKND